MFFDSNEMEIAGIACTVPDEVESVSRWNETFGKIAVNKFIKSTGAKQRFIGKNLGVTASDLCCAAAKKLIEASSFSPDEIDAVLFMSVRRDYESPNTAFLIQYRLGLNHDCICMDVPFGCSSYVNGFMLASALIKSGCRNILLLTGESMHKESENPSGIPALFGAAGSATLIRKKEGSVVKGLIRSYGEDFRQQIIPYGGYRHPFEKLVNELGYNKALDLCGKFYMDGFETMRFSLGPVVECIRDTISHFDTSAEEYDYFVLHQSNKLIIDSIAKKLNLPQKKALMSIDCYANTSGASIPVTLCHAFGNQNESCPINILACGYGIGLSVGAVSFTVNPKNCLPIFKTKERWIDGIDAENFD